MRAANLVGVDMSEAITDGADLFHATTSGDIDFATYLRAFNPNAEFWVGKETDSDRSPTQNDGT